MPAPHQLADSVPTVEEYLALRHATGLGPRSAEGAELGLRKGLYSVVARDEKGLLLGMGRVIGDLGCQVVITDIAVVPSHQGQGLGRAIMARLMDWVHANAAPGAFVSLIAKDAAQDFYRGFGFQARDRDQTAMGLALPIGETGRA